MSRNGKRPDAFRPEQRPGTLAREVVSNLKARLQDAGFSLEPGLPTFGRDKLSQMIPEPDTAFSVKKTHADVQAVVAVHFAKAVDTFSYACTVLGARDELAFERGRLNAGSGAIEVIEARGLLSTDDSKGLSTRKGRQTAIILWSNTDPRVLPPLFPK